MKRVVRRASCVFLCCVIMLGVLSGTSVNAAGSTRTVRASTVPTGFKGIYTPADLNAVRYSLNGKYILMNHIDLTAATASGGAYYNGGKGWDPIGSILSPFSGVLNGNGFTIKGLKQTLTFTMPAVADIGNNPLAMLSLKSGLIGANSGTVKNLGLIGNSITVNSNSIALAGSFAGFNFGELSGCFHSGNVGAVSTEEGAVSVAGGIAAVNMSLTATGNINNCYNSGTVTASNLADRVSALAAGIAGMLNEGAISNCYNAGEIDAGNGASAGITMLSGGTVTNCYFDDNCVFGAVDEYANEFAKPCSLDQLKNPATFSGFDFANIWSISPESSYPYPTIKIIVPVAKITLNTANLKWIPGKSGKFTVTAAPADATNKTVLWKSSNNAVATVDSNGTVKAVGYGSATLTCTAGDGYGAKAVCSITVGKAVTSAKLNVSSYKTAAGTSRQLSASVLPADAIVKTLKWTSSNTKVAAVDGNGLVKAVAVGTATITCAATDGSGKTAVCSVTVGKPVAAVKLNASALKWQAGKTGRLTATVSPSDAIFKTVKWTTSNAKVVTVDSAGNFKAVGIGKAVITCAATDGSGKKAVCTLTVVPQTPTGLKAVKVSSTSIKLTWSKVSGATGYEVYRAASSTGTYTKIKTLSLNYITNTGLARGRTYYYKVVAYKTIGSTVYKSAYSGWASCRL